MKFYRQLLHRKQAIIDFVVQNTAVACCVSQKIKKEKASFQTEFCF